MTENSATAMITRRGELVDRTLETVEDMRLTGKRDLKRLVISVAANLAGRHLSIPPIDCRWAKSAGEEVRAK